MKIPVSATLLEKAARRHELSREWFWPPPRPDQQVTHRVITISRMYGAGGTSVAALVSSRLGWPLWDREILDLLSSESHGRFQPEALESLDERQSGIVADFLSSLRGQAGELTYTHLLPRAIHHIARHDAVILGRGAHLMLPDALRVFLKAPWSNRVERIMELHQLSAPEARKLIERRDRERGDFLQAMRKRMRGQTAEPRDELEQELAYDLEINTAQLGYEGAVELVLLAARTRFEPRL